VRPVGVCDGRRGRRRRKIVAVPSARLTQRYIDVKNYTDLQEDLYVGSSTSSCDRDPEPGKWATCGLGDAADAR
jgi:inorganic pyrophosphatase